MRSSAYYTLQFVKRKSTIFLISTITYDVTDEKQEKKAPKLAHFVKIHAPRAAYQPLI